MTVLDTINAYCLHNSIECNYLAPLKLFEDMHRFRGIHDKTYDA